MYLFTIVILKLIFLFKNPFLCKYLINFVVLFFKFSYLSHEEIVFVYAMSWFCMSIYSS